MARGDGVKRAGNGEDLGKADGIQTVVSLTCHICEVYLVGV